MPSMAHRILKTVLIVLASLSVPIALGGMLWSYRLLFDAVPSWLWVSFIAAHIIVLLGLASLIDELQKQAEPPRL